MDTIPIICRRAEILLTGAYRTPIELEVLEQFESSHTVLRCAVHTTSSADQAPPTVIVKQRTFNQPDAPGWFDQSILFRNESASLDFLASHSDAGALGPRLVASDHQAGLVILEDLGVAQSVQDVLYGANHQAAIDGLVGMGKTLGQLQRITYGHEAEFVALQAALAATSTLCDSSRDCRRELGDLRACMAGLGIDIHSGFDHALHALESAIHGPGIFRTFVHHDSGPHNFAISAAGIKLLDFEFAGYGYGLLDAVCARLAFPPSFRGRMLPREVITQVELGYRLEFTRSVPAMVGDACFNQAISQACTHWAFSKLIGFWNGYLRERLLVGEGRDRRPGKSPQRSAFFRQQVFTYQRLALAALEEFNQLPELRLALDQIVTVWLVIWPDTSLLSSYPAFGGEAWQEP